MRTPVDAICWDWNGTLLDDAAICHETMNDVLVGRGIRAVPTLDDYRHTFRFPIRAFYASVGIGAHEFAAAADEYLGLLGARIADACLQQDALSTLDAVASRGVRQILASATVSDALTCQMAPHGLADRFEAVLGIDDAHAASKAEVITAWVRGSGLAPERVLLIGDTNHDQEIAAALGAQFVHFSGGHQHLAAVNASIDVLPDLLAVLDSAGRVYPRR